MDVSVIIPTYNRLWSLPKAVESCRDNNIDLEIIVVDDGSTDGTWEWLQTQSDVISIYQENQGKCWAVNLGFQVAKGKYVRFLDSDDMFSPNSTNEMFMLAKSEDYDLVVSGHQIIDDNDNIVREHPWQYCDDFISQQLGECDSSHYSAYLLKREFIINIPHRPDFAFRDDRIFCIELVIKKPKIGVLEGFGLWHRVHYNKRLQFNNGIQETVQHYQQLMIYKLMIKKLELLNELTQRRKDASCKILWPLAHWVAKTHLKDAEDIVKWIYKLNPNFIIPEKGILGWMYRKLGFAITERVLILRRILVYGLSK